MESNWRWNAGLLGGKGENSGAGGWQFRKAAKSTLSPALFLTDAFVGPSSAAVFLFVPVGTGVATSWSALTKPAGRDSPFPYGFTVTPDRPFADEV